MTARNERNAGGGARAPLVLPAKNRARRARQVRVQVSRRAGRPLVCTVCILRMWCADRQTRPDQTRPDPQVSAHISIAVSPSSLMSSPHSSLLPEIRSEMESSGNKHHLTNQAALDGARNGALSAKFAEQPQNTRKAYAVGQRSWRVSGLPPPLLSPFSPSLSPLSSLLSPLSSLLSPLSSLLSPLSSLLSPLSSLLSSSTLIIFE